MELSYDIKNLLKEDETILMVLRPKSLPFLVPRILEALFYSTLIFFFYGFSLSLAGANSYITTTLIKRRINQGSNYLFLEFLFIVFFLIPFTLFLIKYILEFRKRYYVITNKRIIIRKGSILTKNVEIEIEKIKEIKLKRYPSDKIFKTGSIEIKSSFYEYIENIENFEKVYKTIENLLEKQS